MLFQLLRSIVERGVCKGTVVVGLGVALKDSCLLTIFLLLGDGSVLSVMEEV